MANSGIEPKKVMKKNGCPRILHEKKWVSTDSPRIPRIPRILHGFTGLLSDSASRKGIARDAAMEGAKRTNEYGGSYYQKWSGLPKNTVKGIGKGVGKKSLFCD
jgi:hypothetical protein